MVSAGTGSKVLGRNEISPGGDVVHDSHAEVVAQRSFRRFLSDQMRLKEKSEVLVKEGERWRLREGVKFHFFSTHPACGAASISDRVRSSCVKEFLLTQPRAMLYYVH